MKTKRTLIALILCAAMLVSFGCAAKSATQENSMDYAKPASGSYDMAAPQAETAFESGVVSSSTQQTGEPTGDFDVRKIVYTADMTVAADDPAAALSALLEKTEALGGYVSGSYSTTDELGTNYAYTTLKVPASQLEALITAANALGKVKDYRLSSDDISLSYYDMQARLDNAKAEEQQLLQILAKCETVEEILAVRQSLTSVRSDIESYTAQMNLWDNLVSYATLNVTIDRTPKTAVEGENELIQMWKASDVWNRMSKGFQNSARFVINAIGAIGIFLAVVAIPAGVLFLLIGVPIIAHKKNKRKKAAALRARQAASAEPDDTVKKNE
ncbi:MAG: DUF4349 domain-containing protein [Eubacteriales bacterium]|jgi:hypothetical protein|nr:DUF4349 domain-containing protein [Eubacteriales bacterium]